MNKFISIFVDIIVALIIVTLALILSEYIVDKIFYSLPEGVFLFFEDSHFGEEVFIHSIFSGIGIALYQIFFKKKRILVVVGSALIISIFYYFIIYFKVFGLDIFLIANFIFTIGLFLSLFITRWFSLKLKRLSN